MILIYFIVSIIIILLSTVITFVPMSYYSINNSKGIETKQIMNLSARVLADSILSSRDNYFEISKGHNKEMPNIEVDKEWLLISFNEMLRKNSVSVYEYDNLKKSIIVKVLVYLDRFYIAGVDDKWSPPYFFCHMLNGKQLYLMSKYPSVYYYNSDGSIDYTTLEYLGLSERQRNSIVLSSLENTISRYTAAKDIRNKITIKIYNPYEEDGSYRERYNNFNVLDGLTFFVLYAEEKMLYSGGREYDYHTYNVTGYTLE